MNFKTTIVLLVLLLGAGAAIWLTQSSASKDESATTAEAAGAKVLDFSAGQVERLAIAPADGKQIVLKRDGFNWQLTEPVVGPADTNLPTEVLSALAAMTSTGKVSTGGEDSSATGLSPPRFAVSLDLKDGKKLKLAVGNRSGTGGQLYVQREGQGQADLVQADVYDLLDKPPSAFRRTKLLDVQTPAVESLTIERAGEPALVLDKKGGSSSAGSWTIEKPTTMPADTAAVTDVLTALSSLQATNFVSETNTDPRRYGLDKPAVRVTFATSQPAATVSLGMLDVLKQNAYASTSTLPGVVQVSASTLDSFKKSPLDLRDKNVVNVDPSAITSITIHTVLPATTQPTTRPASDRTITLQRRAAPTSAPTTSATQPTSKPASQWVIASSMSTPATDSKVNALLSSLHPLKVQKYLGTPATMPAAADHYTLGLASAPPMMQNYEIELIDPGNSQPLSGRYNGLSFDLDRTLIDQLKTDFSKADEPNPANASPAGMPGTSTGGFPAGSLPPG